MVTHLRLCARGGDVFVGAFAFGLYLHRVREQMFSNGLCTSCSLVDISQHAGTLMMYFPPVQSSEGLVVLQVAYIPQAAFIYNATVRENILFGQPFEEERYQRAIEAAALGPDLAQLSGACCVLICVYFIKYT